ncbi:SprB repeat-containing protein, partial [Flavobacterium sp. SM15]|uniref:SprB repeat-containing protein n=1 Tax=Flavobacterium sp. SM15 TaxID=2908005 RepID=UPI001EDB6D82
MKTLLLKNGFWSPFILFTCLLISTITFGQATLVSDQMDYPPGATATFTGSGFEPGEQVIMLVLHYDGTPNTGTDHDSWMVTADEAGNFITTWVVCEDDCLGSTLIATADGLSSNLHAEVIFTDTLDWCLSVSQTSFCSGANSTLSFTASVLGSSSPGQVGTIRVTIPSGFTLGALSITSTPLGKTWAISNSGNIVCITANSNAERIVSGDQVKFNVVVTNPTVVTNTNYGLTSDGNNNRNTCGAVGVGPHTSCPSLNVTVNSPLSVSETHVNVSCSGGSNGSINITPTGGASPYTYLWTGTGVIASVEDQSGLSAGNYSVTVTDNKGCTFTLSGIQITQPAAALSASETHVNVSCFGGSNGSINLTASGGTTPYTYLWTGPGVN